MRQTASWFKIEILEPFVGSAKVDGRTWGFSKVKLDYDKGGWTVATCPFWLVGFMYMTRLIQGVTRRGTTAGVRWNAIWKRQRDGGFVVIHEHVSAADMRRDALRSDPGEINADLWRQSAEMLTARAGR